jgi:hypothetical protein
VYVCSAPSADRLVGAADVRERQATRATRLEVKETILIFGNWNWNWRLLIGWMKSDEINGR